MIINFSVQNFGSIKEKQTLSFEANESTHLEEHYIINVGGLRLTKLALIYGANASGKTTILTALGFLKQIITFPLQKKTDTLDFNPFLFDEKTSKESSIMSINFIVNEVKYFYEVEFKREAILREELYFFNPKQQNIFKRTTDTNTQFAKITFKNKKIKKATTTALEANTLWNNTVFGGFLKTNIEMEKMTEVVLWFLYRLSGIINTKTPLDNLMTSLISKKAISKKIIIEILKKADFNISDLKFKKESEQISSKELVEMEKKIFIHPEYASLIIEAGLLDKFTDLEIEHTINNEKHILPFGLESEGTQRYYGFAGLLSMLIKRPSIAVIDELEASLHPDLYKHFLLTFLMNAENSQLIATTHNREILGNKDIFRDDAIWFTEKNESGATELYSLADFGSEVVKETQNVLNTYKAGGFGAVPHLRDYYIDTDNE